MLDRIEDKHYLSLLGSLNTAVLLADDTLSIVYMNSAAEAILKIGFTKLRGNKIYDLFSEPAQSRRVMREAIHSNQSFTKRHESVHINDTKGNLIDYSATPVQSNNSSYLIIEMQAIERFIRINREEALSSLQDSSRSLIRGLAHEIKNPLGGIRGAAQLLNQELSDCEMSPETLEFCQIIVTEVDRLRNLVDRLLGPNQLPQMRTMNIHEVLDHVVNLMDAETRGSISLVRDYDPSIPDAHGDPEQIIQAILNISRNAMRALQGSQQLTPIIYFKTRVQQSFTLGGLHQRLVCRIDITDNGPGIDPAIKDRIFLPMVSGTGEGAGLGLMIAQTAINRHGGMIECSSVPGETKFSIYLPLKV